MMTTLSPSPSAALAPGNGENAIVTRRLRRAFGSVQAVEDLSLEVPAGQIFGFLGTNGAGKTTTIRLLLGLLEPSGGEARVLGFDPATEGRRIREQSGALLEHNGLYESLSAADNLEFYGRIYGIPKGELKRRIMESLEVFGLADRAMDKAGTFSRGMKQKLAIARAILHQPKLVFLDEPTDGLDPAAAAAVRQDLLDLARREQVTIFLTTHNLTEAEHICSNVAIIRQSALVATGTPASLRAALASPRARITGSGFTPEIIACLRSDNAYQVIESTATTLLVELRQTEDTSDLVSALVTGGARVGEVERVLPSFESAFLQLVRDEQREALYVR